jgi:toxin secretion/phage lysis holin
MNWEVIYKSGAVATGVFVGWAFGGWNTLLAVLLAFVITDYITGIMAGYVEGKLSSKVGFKAIPKKIMIFVLVAVGHLIDTAIGESHLFRDAVIFFYISNEVISILENAGRIGLPIPEQLKQAVQILKGKGEGK